MRSRSKKASELKSFDLYPQCMINIPVNKKTPLSEANDLREAIQEVYNILAGEGRVLVRYSGTEMKLRVMVEAKDEQIATELAEAIAAVAQTTL